METGILAYFSAVALQILDWIPQEVHLKSKCVEDRYTYHIPNTQILKYTHQDLEHLIPFFPYLLREILGKISFYVSKQKHVPSSGDSWPTFSCLFLSHYLNSEIFFKKILTYLTRWLCGCICHQWQRLSVPQVPTKGYSYILLLLFMQGHTQFLIKSKKPKPKTKSVLEKEIINDNTVYHLKDLSRANPRQNEDHLHARVYWS